MTSKLKECAKKGKYFNPSTDHYEDASTNVVCDRCGLNNLSVCIGYKDTDLCLDCVTELSKKTVDPIPTNKPCAGIRKAMKQGIFRK